MGLASFGSSLLLWAYGPRLATNWLMQMIHLHPMDPRHRRNWQLTFSLIVLLYLLYTILQTERDLQPNLYSLLQVPRAPFNLQQLKSNYKQLSLAYHPDKNPNFNDFMTTVKEPFTVHSTSQNLSHKFGIELLERCTRCKTERDYLYHAFSSMFQYYFGTTAFLILYSLLGQGGFGAYWRYLSLLSVFTLELTLLVRPTDPLASFLFPLEPLLNDAQLGPVWFPPIENVMDQRLAELDQFTNMNVGEAQLAFGSIFSAFKDDAKLAGVLQRRMEKVVAESQILESSTVLQEKKRRFRELKKEKKE
ncbi:hypothetical protein BCR33DRAFT_724713 [Rhizoclosmatium globosum]|uniref:J domain-containing protein n=1 Tax=Rhizoclosmatium globosum TaxID=329046 RepID=A0A1Y2B3R2_9FUNG|nr:hypothetical protein BCR33DRAFT_724713 [Rhizoclosmatium globosum]|eukprot:ORY29468.1 hypothetical protein BCR33DRAFT_724713 [Rhizoclosmatium globosum]